MQSPGFSGHIYYLLSQTLFSLIDPSLAEAQKVCIFAQSNSLLLMELDSVEVIATGCSTPWTCFLLWLRGPSTMPASQ